MNTYELYQKVTAKPFGRQAFSAMYMLKAPYFATVRPAVLRMQPNYAVVEVKKRKVVENHIGTLHAIAIANGLEAAMGLLAEATVRPDQRWIPKGMNIEYLTKTPGDVRCYAETDPEQWDAALPTQIDVRVRAELRDGTVVVQGVIPIWVSAKKR